MGICVSFRNLLMRKYLFIFNSLLTIIGRFDFICKTKFCSLSNFVTCYFLIYVTCQMCENLSLIIPIFFELGNHIFFKTDLVIIYFTKNFLCLHIYLFI